MCSQTRLIKPEITSVFGQAYGSRELQAGGAIRVYKDPADVLRHIDEIGGRR